MDSDIRIAPKGEKNKGLIFRECPASITFLNEQKSNPKTHRLNKLLLPFSLPTLKSFNSSCPEAATFKQEMIFYAPASVTFPAEFI
ncbi:hypothetical protein J6I44_02040 [Aliifodinibius sp. 1BSP15-2V2]|uniref:Uncharacterized protein n=2 Tax=Fodinibius salsisoli TaxID=2820877 RepID=A0ABT3PIJ9_9BACT|nr:hypothetical protein [Fodinibius salsisoli]